MTKRTIIPLTLSAALFATGCATTDEHTRAKTGALIGAVAGAVIGHQTDSKHGRELGAVAGALAGGFAGNYMDKQEQELTQKLEAEQRTNAIEIERLKDDTLKLNLNSEVSFATNSSSLNPAFEASLRKLSQIIAKYAETSVAIIGHTDSSGSHAHNQQLSLSRAEAVATFLIANGVTSSRVTTQGAGENQPRADNATPSGRQINRRVEILLRPKTL